jgi:CyaY protein
MIGSKDLSADSDERWYNSHVDTLLMLIEDRLDDLEDDIDVNGANGQLTLTFSDRSQMVISRQPAQQEIWVAARSGGFHLKWNTDHWFCAVTGERFSALLNRVLSEQAGVGSDLYRPEDGL